MGNINAVQDHFTWEIFLWNAGTTRNLMGLFIYCNKWSIMPLLSKNGLRNVICHLMYFYWLVSKMETNDVATPVLKVESIKYILPHWAIIYCSLFKIPERLAGQIVKDGKTKHNKT